MTILPGKHDHGIAGLHWRDLEKDVARLASDLGVQTFVLLVEDEELRATETTSIGAAMAAHGIELLRFPIVDGGVPRDRAAYSGLLTELADQLRAAKTVVITCKGGLGRTGTTVACLLRGAGLPAEAAIGLTRASRKGTIETAVQEAFVRSWKSIVAVAGTPFSRYEGGGRQRLGRPRQGDVTARHGYGPPVFEQCGYACVYCGLDMAATFEAWLQLSVDHVVPRQMVKAGYPVELMEDITNLVTCCRACNDFGNRFVVTDPPPASDGEFYDLRDRVFAERKAMILAKRGEERAIFSKLPAAGPDRPPIAGDEA